MKNKFWIIIAVLFAAIMLLALYFYPKLSENYSETDVPEVAESEVTETKPLELAEDFYVYDTDMNKVNLSDKFGKPVVINFWASWCPSCVAKLPDFNEMHEKYKDEVAFMIINLTDGQGDTVNSVKEFISEKGYTFPLYFDLEFDASTTYGVRSIPETVFINADGTLHGIRIGGFDKSILEDYIDRIK